MNGFGQNDAANRRLAARLLFKGVARQANCFAINVALKRTILGVESFRADVPLRDVASTAADQPCIGDAVGKPSLNGPPGTEREDHVGLYHRSFDHLSPGFWLAYV